MLIWYPSDTEIKIIEAWGKGMNNPEIAAHLNLTRVSVESRIKYLKKRSKIKANVQLLIALIRRGCIKLEDL